jgi:hypothetical protein
VSHEVDYVEKFVRMTLYEMEDGEVLFADLMAYVV